MRYLALLLLPALLSAAAPVVSNVRAQQRLGTKLIDITYDLADSSSTSIYISAQIFAGTTALPAFSLSGHIGAGVTPGTNKTIVWNAGQDWNRQYTTAGKVRIVADDLSVTPPNAGMVYVPAGFTVNGYGVHSGSSRVFSSGFFMDKTEVSKAEWDSVRTWALANGYTFDNTGLATDTTHPVVGISWYDAVKWCNARSEKEGLAPVYCTDAGRTTVYKTGTVIVRGNFCNWSADGYRLPTRAEWSKAAWGGSTSGPYYWPSYYGSGAEILNKGQANFFTTWSNRSHPWDFSATYFGSDNTALFSFSGANYGTTPVGYYNGSQSITELTLGITVNDMKNGFGLYDMAGNAAEWLWDSYYSEVNATTEYLDDNYKGPDLGLGAERFYAEGRFSQDASQPQGSDQAWDAQRRASATSAGARKMVFSAQYTQGFFTNGSGQPTQLVPQVGLRTVRGR
jgi:formylglycine-generating enzyme required for sulfatase activity